MRGVGPISARGCSAPTCFRPTISVQNLCDASMSRTLSTTWLMPTGVFPSAIPVLLRLLIVDCLFRRDLVPCAEARRLVDLVDQRRVAFGRQVLGVVERGVDIAFPHVARQLVEQLDAVAVGVADIEAAGHAVIDPALELDVAVLQEGELPQPRLAAGRGDG